MRRGSKTVGEGKLVEAKFNTCLTYGAVCDGVRSRFLLLRDGGGIGVGGGNEEG